MTDNPNTAPVRESGRWLIWTAGLIVAVGAAVATAHGLYRVAIAATVPPVIGWLYPLITDGLALVAYASTTRLAGAGRRYAWAVVVLAAGLSGLAQASYLAIGVDSAPVQLRFGVGAWPATAAAITAHLLYLLAARPAAVQPEAAVQPTVGPLDGAVQAGVVQAKVVRPGAGRLDRLVQHRPAVQATTGEQVGPAVQPEGAVQPGNSGRLSGAPPSAGPGMPDGIRRGSDGPLRRPYDADSLGLPPSRRAAYPANSAVQPPEAVQSGAVQPVHPGVVHAGPVQATGVQPVQPTGVQPVQPTDPVQAGAVQPVQPEPSHPVAVRQPGIPPVVQAEQSRQPAPTEAPIDRARAAARVHQVTHGDLPSVSELVGLADVARGTAATALRQLRDQPSARRPGLQIVHGDEHAGTNP
jgi:hypothetical protein